MDCQPSEQEPQKALRLQYVICVSTLYFGLVPP